MLNTEHQEIHNRAVRFADQLLTAEAPLLRALTDAYRTKLHQKFERTGLFLYARDILKLDEPTARRFITVAKKCVAHPQLLNAIEQGKFPTSKAARFVSVVNEQNVEDYIKYAATHSYEDLNQKVASECPEKKRRSNHKPLGNGRVRGSYDWDPEFTNKLTKLAKRHNMDPAELIKLAVNQFEDRNDPIKKAERARARKPTQTKPPKELCVDKILLTKRKPIPAATIHQINKRDQAQCTHIHEDGSRCDQTKWLHIHHIKPVSEGGSNELHNLITLCEFHHELRHQLEFRWRPQDPSAYAEPPSAKAENPRHSVCKQSGPVANF